MPTLSLPLTGAQAMRVEAALRRVYASGTMANATLAEMTKDYITSTLRALVLEHERSILTKQIEAQLDKSF